MRYRSEIDGLRAVAVVPVILFHAGVPTFGGGFLGVDVFFVISGYLITGLIVSDLEKGRFSIVEFYERRARRILPALLVVMLTCLLITALAMRPDDLKEMGESALAISLFVSNIYFWSQSGYFGSASELTPLLHTWSLAVEEQYYVLFPLFMAALWSFGKGRVATLIFVGALVSLALAEWGSRNAPLANFFLTPTRVWELAAGALAALVPRSAILGRLPGPLREVAGIAGLAAVIASVIIFDEGMRHPSVLTLVPVLGTVAVIMFVGREGPAGRLLSSRPFVGIGLISYSLYLWHQPLFAFTRLYLEPEPGPFVMVALIALSFFVAALSWRFIEQPFRDRSRLTRRRVFVLAGSSTSFAMALGACVIVAHTVLIKTFDAEGYVRYRSIHEATSQANQRAVNRGCRIWSKTFNERFVESFERCAERYGKALFITGDSHGIDLYNAVARAELNPFVASVSRGYCRAHAFLTRSPPHRCHYEDLEAFVRDRADKIDLLIYTQTPDRLFPERMQVSGPGDLSVESIDQVLSYLSDLVIGSAVNILVLGPLPPLAMDPRQLDPRRTIESQLDEAVSPHLLELTAHVDRVFGERAGQAGIPYLSKIGAMDLKLPDQLVVDGHLTYSDRRHLSIEGERHFGPLIARRVNGLNGSAQ